VPIEEGYITSQCSNRFSRIQQTVRPKDRCISCFVFQKLLVSPFGLFKNLHSTPKFLIQCGLITFDFALFWELQLALPHWVNDKAYHKLYSCLPLRLLKLCVKHAKPERGEERPLLYVMEMFSNSQCEGIRDKVFGFLNLGAKCCQIAVLLNYPKKIPSRNYRNGHRTSCETALE
jgi:hypothetical protein